MYTIRLPDGTRDLVLEKGLSQLESEFVIIREDKLHHCLPLKRREHILLCAFTVVAGERTPSTREHWRTQLDRPLRMMEEVMEKLNNKTPEEVRELMKGFPSSSSNEGISYEDLKQISEHPLQAIIPSVTAGITSLLCKLDMAVFVTGDEIGFITSPLV